MPISVTEPVAGRRLCRGRPADRRARRRSRVAVLDLAEAERLPGAHNWQNAAAAYAVARARRASRPRPRSRGDPLVSRPRASTRTGRYDRRRTLYQRFEGHQRGCVPKRRWPAIEAIYWIAGGLAKAGGITSLAPYFERLRHAFLIGNATEEFAATLDGKVPFTRCGDLATALAAATEQARARAASRAPSCCCRRPAPPTTSSPISRCAATRFRDLVARAAEARSRRMMFARIDQSPVARWWWTVDRWTLGALAIADRASASVLSMAASPAVAERLGYDALHFAERHLVDRAGRAGDHVRACRCCRRARSAASRLSASAIALALLALTFVIGAEIKGARRWINLPGLSLQPSEFVKPTFAVVAAWLFAEQKERPGLSRQPDLDRRCSLAIVAMLIKQPDLGMAASSRWSGSRSSSWPGCGSTGSAAGALGRRRRAGRRLSVAAARHQPDQPLPRSRGRRQLSGQPLARSLRQWRAVGPRAGRRHGQGRAARRACRFRLRRRRRGIRRSSSAC